MSLDLPVTISAEGRLSEKYGLTKQVLEQLEAWANFETLKANWYGDDSRQISTKFVLVSKATFDTSFDALIAKGWIEDLALHCIYNLSDDLNSCTFMFYPANENEVTKAAVQQALTKLLNIAAITLKLDNLATS